MCGQGGDDWEGGAEWYGSRGGRSPGLRLTVGGKRDKVGDSLGRGASFRLPGALGARVLGGSPRKTVLCTGARRVAAPSRAG